MTYARRAKELFSQMKAADPTIKIGVVVAMTWKERAGVLLDALKQMQLGTFITEGYQGWTPKMLATLKQLGVRPDFVICHRYPVESVRVRKMTRLSCSPPPDGRQTRRPCGGS